MIIVFDNACSSSSKTGRPEKIELPKLPCRARISHLKYWTISGWS